MSDRAEWAPLDYWPRENPVETVERLDQCTSRRFHDLMDAAMLVSDFKYGNPATAYPEKRDAIASLHLRLAKYLETGNVEYLVDAANFAMIEFMHPKHPRAHYAATDADGSPGRVHADGSISQFANDIL